MSHRDDFLERPPTELLARWQAALNLLAEIGGIPAVSIGRFAGDLVETALVSSGGERWLPVGGNKPVGAGCYCDRVMFANGPVHVRDARVAPDMSAAIDLAGGLVSYLGYPLRWPDGTLFGTLCALDADAHDFSDIFRRHFEQAVRAMEAELAVLDENARLRREVEAHRKTAQALRVTEHLHNEAQRIAMLGHWHHDLRSDELVWSDEMFRLCEIDKAKFPASYAAFLALVHPEDRQLLDDTFNRAIAERTEFRLKYRLLMKDGRTRWMTARAATTYDADGRPLFSTGTTQDISARMAAEHALQESEALHRQAQAMANLGHWRLNLVDGTLEWSDQLFNIFEIDKSRFAASYDAFLKLVHPDERAALDAAYNRSVANRTAYDFEHRLVMPDGRIKWVVEHCVTRYAADGTPLESIGTAQDITARKEAARERDMLAEVVRHSRELINVADLDGRMVFLNVDGGRLLGIDPAQVTRHLITDVIPPGLLPLVHEELLPALGTAGYWDGELQYRNIETGELRDFHATCFRIDDRKSGAPSYIANVSIDITERKAADRQREALERQLLHVQKLESLGVMAGGIAHDFNNILQAIIGNLEIIDPAHPDGPASREALARARQGAIRAADITRQLLTFAGRDIQPRQHLDLGQIVEESANLVRSVIDKRIALRVVPPPGPLPVEAVAGQVQQVLINLVTNAADAIGDDKGTIIVACGRGPEDKAWLEVQDSGSGMDEETQARLFDPFFTSKAHGRGLGMASVLGIVRAHDATIDVASAPGRGTTVRVVLPMSGAATTATAPAHMTSQPDTRPAGTLLLVDDDEAIRIVGHALLQRSGFSVTCAAGGAEAIAMLGDDTRRFACVILDLTMPDIDGADVFHALRERHPDLPVLLSSGYDYAEALRRIRPSAHTGFIRKPWRGDELVSALGALLQHRA